MNGRTEERFIAVESYSTNFNCHAPKNVWQMNEMELLENSIVESSRYFNNSGIYSLLFTILEKDKLFFVGDNQEKIQTYISEQVFSVLETLTPREEKIIKSSFGLEDGRARSIFEIAYDFNVTPERITQIKRKAIRKLRTRSRKDRIMELLFLVPDFPTASRDALERQTYTSFIEEQYKNLKPYLRLFLKTEGSMADIFYDSLSKIYSEEHVKCYFETLKESFPQFFRYIDRNSINCSTMDALGLTESSYWRAFSNLQISDMEDLYKLYFWKGLGKLSDELMGAKGIGKVRVQKFLEKCIAYFAQHNLIFETDVPYEGDFLKDSIMYLEELLMQGKTAVCSSLIPSHYLEVCLMLNYRTIEDILKDYYSGELERKCNTEYVKLMFGDIYGYLEELINRIVSYKGNFCRVRLVSENQIPVVIAEKLAIETLKQKQRSEYYKQLSYCATKAEILPYDCAEEYTEEFIDIDDDTELELNLLLLEDIATEAPVVSINDLYIPVWIKGLLSNVGISTSEDLIDNQIGYTELLYQFNAGVLNIEKIYTALNNEGVHLHDCNYSDVGGFLENQRGHFPCFTPYKDGYTELITCCRGTKYVNHRPAYYFSKKNIYCIGEYVLVSTGNSDVSMIQIAEIEHVLLSDIQAQYDLPYWMYRAAEGNAGKILEKATVEQAEEYLQKEIETKRARQKEYRDKRRLKNENTKKLLQSQREQKYPTLGLAQSKKDKVICSEKIIVAQLTRQELYDEIWEISVSGVAKKYGANYAKLLKQVKNSKIPVPSRRYWGLISVGKPAEKIELSAPLDEIISLVK